MASGDVLNKFFPYDNQPPSASYATLDHRNLHPVLDFDAAADESAVFSEVLDGYAGGGLTVEIGYYMTSATSGDVVLTAEIERIGVGVLDIDADSFAAANSVTDTVPGTSGTMGIATITFTDGADMDSLADGEAYRIRITRDADNVADDATGDLELAYVKVSET